MTDRADKQHVDTEQRGVQEVVQTVAAAAVTAKIVYDVAKDKQKPKQ